MPFFIRNPLLAFAFAMQDFGQWLDHKAFHLECRLVDQIPVDLD